MAASTDSLSLFAEKRLFEVQLTGRHGAEGGAALHAALAGLPDRQGEAVRLRDLEGLSLAETATRLETSESAVKALVGRGLTTLGRSGLGRDRTSRAP